MSNFRKAERRKAKLRLAITGSAGSGKTYGALLVAQGLGGRIAMIDTENGSGDLYSAICDYDILNIDAPFDPRKYIQAIHEAENECYEVLIIDSLSHCWISEGGLLDMKEALTASGKYNSFSAWSKVTPLQNKLIEAMLTSKCHIIATMRSKTDYMQVVNDKGRTEIRKVGLAPVQRDGMDYEFSIVFDLNGEHTVTVSKDRTSLFDGQSFKLSREIGSTLLEWLNSGKDIPDPRELNELKQSIYREYLSMFKGNKHEVQSRILEITEGRGSKDWSMSDIEALQAEISKRQERQEVELDPAVNQ